MKTFLPPLLRRKLFLTFIAILFITRFAFAQSNTSAGATAFTACVTGTMFGATYTAGEGVSTCTGGTDQLDVWYTYTATATNPVFSASSLGSRFTNARIQILTGTSGSFTQIACGTVTTGTTFNPTNLVIGTPYVIRLYSTNTPVPSTAANGGFTICVTNPPANDLCANATGITSSGGCSTTAGNITAATTYTSMTTACSTNDDLWYSFTAQSTSPTINIGGALSNARFQVYTAASCGGTETSQFCSTSSSGIASGLTIGSVYLVRVYSNTAATGSFAICVTDPPLPANNLCASATAISSSTSCGTTAGTLVGATYTAITSACGSSSGNRNDVWYSFTAQSPVPTVTLAGLTQGRFQIYTAASCSGVVTSVYCSTTASEMSSGLTVGANYLVRVYSDNNTQSAFTICIVDPTPPANDNCSGFAALASPLACPGTTGTLVNATASGIATSCGNSAAPDVWYRFTASSNFPVITLDYGQTTHAQFKAETPSMQIFSGSCAGLTEVGCIFGSAGNNSIVFNPNLVSGATYYIRISTKTIGNVYSGTDWGFRICIQNPTATAPTVDYGKSYVNITKGAVGGTIEPGDVLEMRGTFAVTANCAYGVRFNDTIPANTTYIPGTLRVLTNEGKIYQQFTDGVDSDPASITGSNLVINMGMGAGPASGGAIKSTNRPSLFGSTCVVVASYRVTVDAVALGTGLIFGKGTITYQNQPAASNIIVRFPPFPAQVYKNYGICSNTIGSNGIVGGTFGSGTSKDGGASAKVPSNYSYVPFAANNPGDYYYGVSNNTSAGTTVALFSNNPNEPVATKRVFNVWDITGDHTNASNPLTGNLPTTTSSANGGYMVVINASYRADTAFKDLVTGLCPNTSYEYSAWFRNMCRTCGNDSLGISPSAVGYIPTGPGDTSGVHPNLTFNINGTDYYTTGDILYTGQWIKKGFTYRTGPLETSMAISIRNNAPGGGGNDWAIDDIGLATCSPLLDVNPSDPNLTLCYGNAGTLSAVVRSFFDNYTYYVWERSTNNGVTFTPTAYSGSGTITPTFNGTEYEYAAPGPTVVSDSFVHGDIYRLRVATTAANIIDPNCSFLATRTVQILAANCAWLLKTDLLNASGVLQNNFSRIQWQTLNESEKVNFEIERSADGKHFISIGKVQGVAASTGGGSYNFTDPNSLKAAAYYRIKMYEGAEFKYSKIILLSPDKLFFDVRNLVNPFISNLSFDVIVPADGDIRVTIHDNFGRTVKSYTERVSKGISAIKIQNLDRLSSGTYAVRIQWQNEALIKRVIKLNN